MTIRRVFLATGLLILSGCFSLFEDGSDPSRYPEVARLTSPDGKLDAVLVEDGGDATTGVFHNVFVVPRGGGVPHTRDEVVAVFEWAFRNDSALGVNFRWRARDTLALEYVRAAHQNIKRPSVDGPNGTVTVVFARGVVDSTAPAGSMIRRASEAGALRPDQRPRAR